MKEYKVDVYYFSTEYLHGNFFLPPWEQRVKFMTGFTGTYACCVVGFKFAYLYTDARYYK